MQRLISHSPEETRKLAAILAQNLNAPIVVTLEGDLGAGKTCFAQGFVEKLAGEQATSPTFALSQRYTITQGPLTGKALWHYDLYRLQQAEEAEETGLFEAMQDGVLLIEWPQIVSHWLPPSRIAINFCFADDPQSRIVEITQPEVHKLDDFLS